MPNIFYSPLRYPGGKNKLSRFISQICETNAINGHYIEPYAGGASVALYLLLENKVAEVTINDIDRSIYAFWHSVLTRTNELCERIEKTEINISNWRKAKEILKKKSTASLIDLGFSTFYLNRTNVSGIIDGGVIGGIKQEGEYKMDCRFKKDKLIKRIKRISDKKKFIHLYNLDAVELINRIIKKSHIENTIFYLDPPYYLKGKSLYINHYDHEDHKKVSDLIKSINNIHWIVSYDNNPKIRNFYKDIKQKIEYSLLHTAHKAKMGKEILFFSETLTVPKLKLYNQLI